MTFAEKIGIYLANNFEQPSVVGAGKISLWLDDVRDPADHGYGGALWVRSARVAIQLLQDNFHMIGEMSLDHDLVPTELGPSGDGYEVVAYCETTGRWPAGGVRVHSSNTPSRERMLVPIRAHYGRDFQWEVGEGSLL